VLTWGSAEDGRLGRKRGRAAYGGSERSHALPEAVAMPSAGHNLVSVSAGGDHTVCVSASGALWLWGRVGREVYSTPQRALGERLGSAHFLRAHASEWLTLAVAVPPRDEDEGDP
jgi:hypothetical protein